MTTCPKCNYNTLLQSMREDHCTNCGYTQRYEDAYAQEDPGGDFENSEDKK
jgi:Zn ribbon nucleic-acid-binding protein